MWNNVQKIDHNGILIAFEVLYVPLNIFDGVLAENTVNVSSNNRSIMLIHLQEYVEYNISIRAFTSVGAGPFSTTITGRTSEDGKMELVHYSLLIRYYSYIL